MRASLFARVEALLPELRAIRHDLHQHPELGFEERRTQSQVRAFLERHGYQPRVSAETGLIADLGNPGPTLALRADLDCLPIHEDTALAYRSVHPGRAHKCGHDGHTTILLGVAAVLAEHRALPINVRFLFQPAEEGVRGGGARVMVAEGALDGVREVYGLHNWPGYPEGVVRVRPGAMMAQVHKFEIRITGVGGHGSQPQLCKDPIVAGAQLIVALQTIASRELGYDGGAVLSVGAFHAGEADNIIPAQAHLKGTIRTFDPQIAERVVRRLNEVVSGTAQAMGVQMHLEVEVGYPVLMNDPTCSETVAEVARVIGAPVSGAGLPMAGGEDFAYFTQVVPGAYFFLGAQKPGHNTPVCHHPDFDFEDALIPLGMKMFLGIVAQKAETWR